MTEPHGWPWNIHWTGSLVNGDGSPLGKLFSPDCFHKSRSVRHLTKEPLTFRLVSTLRTKLLYSGELVKAQRARKLSLLHVSTTVFSSKYPPKYNDDFRSPVALMITPGFPQADLPRIQDPTRSSPSFSDI